MKIIVTLHAAKRYLTRKVGYPLKEITPKLINDATIELETYFQTAHKKEIVIGGATLYRNNQFEIDFIVRENKIMTVKSSSWDVYKCHQKNKRRAHYRENRLSF